MSLFVFLFEKILLRENPMEISQNPNEHVVIYSSSLCASLQCLTLADCKPHTIVLLASDFLFERFLTKACTLFICSLLSLTSIISPFMKNAKANFSLPVDNYHETLIFISPNRGMISLNLQG